MNSIFEISNYYFNPYAVPVFIVGTIILILGVIVFLNRRNIINFSFLLLCLSLSTWLLGFAMIYMCKDEKLTRLWLNHVVFLGVAFISPSFYLFTVSFMNFLKKQRWIVISFFIISAIYYRISIIDFNIFFVEMRHFFWGWYPIWRMSFMSFLFFFFLLLIICFYNYKIYFKSNITPIERKQARFILVGQIIAYIASFDFLAGFGLNLYTFGYIPICAYIFIISYAIIKYRLLIITSEIASDTIINTMDDSLIVFGLEGNIMLVNPITYNLLGYKNNELIGENIHKIVSGNNEIKKEILDSIITKQQVQNYEITYLTKEDKQIPVSLSISPIKDKMGTILGFVGIGRDVTERKLFESELKKAKEQAEMANKAKSEFLANMSHEIRTPMNAILGFSEILNEMIGDNPKYKDYISSIYTSGKNLLQLINDILDLSKIEAGKMEIELEAMNPYNVINDVKQIFTFIANKKNIQLLVEIDPILPKTIILNETRLRQVLFNLIGNAVKFTRTGLVKIEIRAESLEVDGSRYNLYFNVIDTGIGIPEAQLEAIFEPFRQTAGQSTREFGGTGLGLTITKRLVNIMNGTISVKSVINKGSNFQVFFKDVQVAAVEIASENEEETKKDIYEFEPAKILIVEDIESNRKVIRGYLESYNFTIIEAVNGQEGVDLANKENPDVILMDMQMPVMDGYQATKILKANTETLYIPVIAVTASVMKENESEVKEVCNAYLRKPVSKKDLLNILAKFLNHKVIKTEGKNEKDIPDLIITELKEKTTNGTINIHELVNDFSDKLLPLYNSLGKNLYMNKIKEFAELVIKIGESYELKYLIQYGNSLKSQVDSFNINQINTTLEIFGKTVESVFEFYENNSN